MTKRSKRIRALEILTRLKRLYPDATCSLTYNTPVQLLVATILSAQSTDKRVNMVTPALFKNYRTARDYANAPQSQLENAIKSTGFYRNKAKNVIALSQQLIDLHGGAVPDRPRRHR